MREKVFKNSPQASLLTMSPHPLVTSMASALCPWFRLQTLWVCFLQQGWYLFLYHRERGSWEEEAPERHASVWPAQEARDEHST